MRYECGTEPQFPCPLCPHRAKHKQALQYHAIARHYTRLWEPEDEMFVYSLDNLPILLIMCIEIYYNSFIILRDVEKSVIGE